RAVAPRLSGHPVLERDRLVVDPDADAAAAVGRDHRAADLDPARHRHAFRNRIETDVRAVALEVPFRRAGSQLGGDDHSAGAAVVVNGAAVDPGVGAAAFVGDGDGRALDAGLEEKVVVVPPRIVTARATLRKTIAEPEDVVEAVGRIGVRTLAAGGASSSRPDAVGGDPADQLIRRVARRLLNVADDFAVLFGDHSRRRQTHDAG